MSPRHHPASALLLDYAARTANAEHTRVLAAHVMSCPACQAEVALAERIGGEVLEALTPAPMAADALDRALAALDRQAAASPAEDRPVPQDPILEGWIAVPPEVAQAAVRRRRWAAPGVWVAPISHDRASGRRSYLLRVGPGMVVPHHGHRGDELTVILKGGFRDGESGFDAGDFALVGEAVEHHPQATAESECICLIAADAPLIPLDWVGRMFQPFVRI